MNKAPHEIQPEKTKIGPCAGLTFLLVEETGQLKASLSKTNATFDSDLHSIRKQLSDEGFDQFKINDETLLSVLKKARNGEQGEFIIGELEKPVSIIFDYLADKGELFAVIGASEHNQEHSFDSIQKALINQNLVDFDIKDSAVTDLALKAKQNKQGRYLLGRKSEHCRLVFIFEEDTGKLIADLRPSNVESQMDASESALDTRELDEPINLSLIQQSIENLGYSRFFFDQTALSKLVFQIKQNEYGQFPVGEKRDAEVNFEYDDDFMSAFITITPPHGGKEVDQRLLKSAFATAGVYEECCLPEAIQRVLKEKAVDRIKIAKGIEPVDGKDAAFEALVQEVEFSTPRESKTGKIDLREIINFKLVEAGTPLMRRIPAVPGVNGRNVRGQVIPAYDGEDTPYDENLDGVAISQTDPDILESQCNGHPVILARGVKVDNTIIVNNVDMSTGNINYDGSVLVKGEVKAGMRISVSGDIIVKGVVTKAVLQAKNNITIECGVIGSEPTKNDEESPPTIIKAGGNITAQYINLAEIHAGRDLIIKEYISHCQVTAKHQILAGQSGGRGRVFGGECYGRSGIYAKSLGASGGVKTHLIAGTPIEQARKFKQLTQNNEHRQEQLAELGNILKKYEEAYIANPTDIGKAQKAKSIRKVIEEIKQDIDKMSCAITKIQKALRESNQAEISVAKSTFPNVEISINGADFFIRQESKGGIFVKVGSDIQWKNFKRK